MSTDMPVASPAPEDDDSVRMNLPLTCLHLSSHNRTHREADIEAMANSMEAVGQQVDGTACVDPTLPEGHYRLLDGHLRYAGKKRAGLTHMWVKVLQRAHTPAQAAEKMVVTGTIRAAMRPTQEGEHYRMMMAEFGLDQAGLARRLGVNPLRIHGRLQLKNGHEDIRHAVDFKGLDLHIANELIRKARVLARQAEILKQLYDLGIDKNRVVAFRHIKKETTNGKASPAPKPAKLAVRVERTRKALEATREWARALAAEIDRLLKLNITEAAMADTLIEKFGLKGK